ncbi:uncharacterized protein [Procambarus clarkii]|uniref:uncharacterized protein n=1 Tax=Procambarus clarkii TaxID=6728 RepID=UPI0037449F32
MQEGLIREAENLAGPDNHRFVSEPNLLYLANGLDPIIVPGASFTASTTTPETTTRTTTRSISTQTPEPPMTRTTQTEVIPSPAPNTATITISTAAPAHVLSTHANSTINTPETASTTRPRRLSLPQAARRKTITPTTEVTDSSDQDILVGALPLHHKYDTYSVQDLLVEAHHQTPTTARLSQRQNRKPGGLH